MELDNGSTQPQLVENPNKSFALLNNRLMEDSDSNCSTPYVSAPSSPGRTPTGYFFSAPTSPMHYITSTASCSTSSLEHSAGSFEFDFDFSARFSSESKSIPAGSMISADELFLNGQIRPMKLSSLLQRPQVLAPLLDLEAEDEQDDKDVVRGRDLRLRNRSLHRRARSHSPLRNINDVGKTTEPEEESSADTTPASSRSSSSGSRSSKRWDFLKDFLRSKSEGRGNTNKEKFWNSLSFSPVKDKKTSSSEKKPPCSLKSTKQTQYNNSGKSKPANGVSKRRVPPSAHELHYTAKRAQAEEMKKKTFLPYRQGLLGCLGFSSKGYGAMNGFVARSLNPVSSR